jgi:hypothetical protein
VPGGVFAADAGLVRMLVGAGDATPLGGIFAKFSERVALNDAGAVAFTAVLKDAMVAQAVFTVERGRPRKVVALGDGAPGGGVFSHFGLWPAVSATGAAAFTASVDGGRSPAGVFVATPTRIERLVGIGDTLAAGGALASFGLYPIATISPAGDVAFATAPTATGEGVEGIFSALRSRTR